MSKCDHAVEGNCGCYQNQPWNGLSPQKTLEERVAKLEKLVDRLMQPITQDMHIDQGTEF